MVVKLIEYYKKIYKILESPYKRKFKIILFLIFIAMILENLSIGIFIPLISALFGNNILDNYINLPTSKDYTVYLLFLTVGVFFVKNIYLILINLFKEKFIADLEVNTSMRLFKNYLKFDYSKILLYNNAKLIRNVKDETGAFGDVVKQLSLFLNEIIISLGILFFLFYLNFLSTLIISLSLLISAFAIYLINKRKISSYGKKRIILDEKINKHIIQGFTAAKDIKILNSNKNLIFKLNKSLEDGAKVNIFIRFINILPRFIFEILIISVLVGLILIFLKTNFTTYEIITSISIFAIAATRLAPAALKIISSYQILKFKSPVVNLVYRELIEKEVKKDRSRDKKIKQIIKFNKQFEIKNLFFKYGSKFVLKNINLQIYKKDVIGVFGETGSGKTTLINIICGLLDPFKGKVLIDKKNVNINDLSWHKKISYVPQEIYLTEDTLEKNVAFGLKQNQIDSKKVKKALKISHLKEVVKYLPKGQKTLIGEKGFNLSGGQRQRIGLARAIYLNKEILILDEATNSLDKDIELKVIKNILKFYKNKTIIIITHEPSLMKFCKNTYFLNKGKLFKKNILKSKLK